MEDIETGKEKQRTKMKIKYGNTILLQTDHLKAAHSIFQIKHLYKGYETIKAPNDKNKSKLEFQD